MNNDRIEGTLDDIAGRAEEGYGDLAGNEEHKVRGMARQAKGRMQDAYGEAREYAQHAGERVVRHVHEQPVTSLLVVGAIGYVLGLLTARR